MFIFRTKVIENKYYIILYYDRNDDIYEFPTKFKGKLCYNIT